MISLIIFFIFFILGDEIFFRIAYAHLPHNDIFHPFHQVVFVHFMDNETAR